MTDAFDIDAWNAAIERAAVLVESNKAPRPWRSDIADEIRALKREDGCMGNNGGAHVWKTAYNSGMGAYRFCMECGSTFEAVP